ncbi:MAG TPA: DUF423 domain-containing protein [Casimicrobiaceae bacterium]|nr:DUF423 domain-containing protein [Casimicrobiaceae bacterium]
MTARLCVIAGAIALAAGVVLGAFGAHAIKGRIGAESFSIYQTAVQYHFWHALGLLGVGILMAQWPGAQTLAWSAWLLIAGLILFAGSLYALALTGAAWLGAIAPFGGAAFIAAWLVVAWAALKAPS